MVLRNEGGLLGGANGGEGGWRVGDVTVSSAVRKGEPDAAEQQRTSAFNLHVSCHDIAAIWVAFFSRWQRYRC